MDAVMAALVAAAIVQAGDRPAWLAAILSSRFRASAGVATAGVIALAINAGLAAAAGAYLSPMLTPEAKALLLALALAFAGGGAMWPMKRPDALDGWRVGAFATGLFGLLILDFGGSAQFVTAAIAARSAHPVLAGVGAAIGSAIVIVAAALAGEDGWARYPVKPVRWVTGTLLLVVAAVMAIGALRLG